jgi:hypothetical protein
MPKLIVKFFFDFLNTRGWTMAACKEMANLSGARIHEHLNDSVFDANGSEKQSN